MIKKGFQKRWLHFFRRSKRVVVSNFVTAVESGRRSRRTSSRTTVLLSRRLGAVLTLFVFLFSTLFARASLSHPVIHEALYPNACRGTWEGLDRVLVHDVDALAEAEAFTKENSAVPAVGEPVTVTTPDHKTFNVFTATVPTLNDAETREEPLPDASEFKIEEELPPTDTLPVVPERTIDEAPAEEPVVVPPPEEPVSSTNETSLRQLFGIASANAQTIDEEGSESEPTKEDQEPLGTEPLSDVVSEPAPAISDEQPTEEVSTEESVGEQVAEIVDQTIEAIKKILTPVASPDPARGTGPNANLEASLVIAESELVSVEKPDGVICGDFGPVIGPAPETLAIGLSAHSSIENGVLVVEHGQRGGHWQEAARLNASALSSVGDEYLLLTLPAEVIPVTEKLLVRLRWYGPNDTASLFLDSLWIELTYSAIADLPEATLSAAGASDTFSAHEMPVFNLVAPPIEASSLFSFLNIANAQEEVAPSRWREEHIEVSATLAASDGTAVEIESSIQRTGYGKFKIQFTSPPIRPGQYVLEAFLRQGSQRTSLRREFSWGVLAVNTDQSVYRVGDEVLFGFGVLGDAGETICDAVLEARITDPQGQAVVLTTTDGSIQTSGICSRNSITNTADYVAQYQTTAVGTHYMTMTATTLTGTHTLVDTFSVLDALPYRVRRFGASRIYPKEKYLMTIEVTADREFSGIVKESVPANFQITPGAGLTVREEGKEQVLAWEVSLAAGERRVLSYEYDAPDISPSLYELGPLRVTDSSSEATRFRETRYWHLASDGLEDVAIDASAMDLSSEVREKAERLMREVPLPARAPRHSRTVKGNFESYKMAKSVSLALDRKRVPANARVKVIDPEGAILQNDVTLAVQKDRITVAINPAVRGMRPGKYTLEARDPVTDAVLSTEEYAWGVLAFNPDYAVYPPNTPANFSFGVLDDAGRVLCDAGLVVIVTDPKGKQTVLGTGDGSIRVNEECYLMEDTQKSDYEANYTTTTPGTYQVTVIAKSKNGERTLHDSFSVNPSAAFYLKRSGPTRTYHPATYTYALDFTAKNAGTYEVTEKVPASFTVTGEGFQVTEDEQTKSLQWQVTMAAGETKKLSYQFKGPPLSPYLFLLGAAEVKTTTARRTWVEPRQWMLASDLACTSNVSPSGNWSASGSWTSCGGVVPTTSDTVTIAAGDTITLNTNTAAGINSLTINDTGVLVEDSSSRTITIDGTTGPLFTNSGTFTANTSTVVINTNTTLTLFSGTFTTGNKLNNLTFSPAIATSTKTYTMGVAVDIGGAWNSSPTGTANLDLNVTLSGTTKVTGLTTLDGTGCTGTDGTSLRTVLSTGTDQQFETGTINIKQNGESCTLTGNASVIKLTGTSGTLFTRAGTFTQGTSDVQVTSASGTPTLLSAATTFHKLTINASGATVINMGAFAPTINNVAGAQLYVQAGVFNASGASITGPGSGNGTLQIDAGATLCLGGTTTASNTTCDLGGATDTTTRAMPTFQTYTFSTTSTVSYLADADTTVSNTPTYGNLKFAPVMISTNRVYTLGGVMIINGNFNINGNESAASTPSLTVNTAGAITVASDKTTTIQPINSATSVLDLRPVVTNYNLTTGFLSVQSGGTLDAGSATSTITLNGTSGTLFTLNSGTFTVGSSIVAVTSASGPVTLGSTGITFNGLTINASGVTVNAGGVITMSSVNATNDQLYIQAGTLDTGAYSIVGSANGTMVMDSGTSLKIGAAGTASTFPTNYTNGIITLNSASTVVYQAGVDQNVSNVPTYGNLTITPVSGTPNYTLLGTTTVANDLVVNSGSLSLSSETINVNHSSGTGSLGITGAGTIYCGDGNNTCAAGTTTFTTGGSGTVGGGAFTFYSLTFYGSSGTTTLGGAITVVGILNCGQGTSHTCDTSSSGNYTVTASWLFILGVAGGTNATFNANASTITATAALWLQNIFATTSRGTLNAGSSTINVEGGNFGAIGPFYKDGGTFNEGTSTLKYANTNTAIVVEVGATYYNLEFNSSGSYTTAGTLTVTRSLTVTSTLSLGANSLVVGSSSVTNSGIISVSGTLSQSSAGTTSIRSSTGGTATIGGSGTITFYNLTFDPSVAAAPTFTLGSAGSQTIAVTNTLTIGNGTDAVVVNADTNDVALDVNGAVSIAASGTLVASSSASFTVAGAFTLNTSGTFTHSSGTVTFDGTEAITYPAASITFYNLTIPNAVTRTATSSTSGLAMAVANVLTTTGSGALTAADNESLNLTKNGGTPLVAGGSSAVSGLNVVSYIPAGAATTITGTTYNNLYAFPSTATTLTLGGNTTVTGNLLVVGGAAYVSTFDTSAANSYSLTVGGNMSVGINVFLDFIGVANLNASVVDVGGDVAILNNASAVLNAGSTSAFTVGGNWLNGATSTFTAGTSTVTFDAGDAGNTIETGGDSFYNVAFNNAAGDWTFSTSAVAITNDLTLTAGTLAGTNDFTVNGSVTGASGVMTLTGGTFLQRVSSDEAFGSAGSATWTLNNLTFENSSGSANRTVSPTTSGTGSVVISGTLTLGNAGDSFSLTFDNSTADTRDFDINDDLVITSKGGLTASATKQFTLADDFTNNGTFTHSNGTITLDTTSTAVLVGSGSPAITFYNLTSTTAGKTLEFTASETFRVNGLLTITGAVGNQIHIHSTSGATQWLINHQGTENITYAHVEDSGCDGSSTSISLNNTSTDGDGNNGSCWLLPSLAFALDSTSANLSLTSGNTFTTTATNTLTVTSRSGFGYKIYAFVSGVLTRVGAAETISHWTGTNATPTTWTGTCSGAAECGFGYSTDDSDLTQFSSTKYAGFTESGPGDVVATSSSPASSEVTTMTYRASASATQAAGLYQTTVRYLVVPEF